MRAGIYIRVSSDRQVKEGESLAEQEATIQAYCNFRDIPIITIYREEGRSGKDTNRPQFQKMIRDCKLGKIDTVVVKKIDRLSRSLMDFEKTIKFFEDHNVNLISIQENFDTSTAIGRAVIRIILTFAQLEREQTSERTIDVMKYRAEQGLWNGGYPPLGYDYDKELGLIINIDEAKIVIIIFDKYIEFASYEKVAEYINNLGYRTKKFTSRRGKEKGGTKFIDTSISTILKNPIYIGIIRYKDELYRGKHQPILDKEKFDKVQEIMKYNSRRNTSVMKANKHNFLLEGLLRCGECGSIMTPKWSISSIKQRYFYYGCTSVDHSGTNACTIKSISAPILEQVILSYIRTVSNNEPLLQKIINQNSQDFKREIEELESKRLLLKLKLQEVEGKASNLITKVAQLPELSKISFVSEELVKLEKDKESIKQEIDQIVFKVDQLKNRVVNKDLVKESLQRFNQIYHELTPDLKRYLAKLLIKEIIFTKTKITVNFFETNDICEFDPTSHPPSSLAPPLDWLPSEHPKPIYAGSFNIDTYQGERGKYYIKMLLGEISNN